MKIVVFGGTGRIGSKFVSKLGEHGHEVVAAAPDTGVDTLTGEGLADALTGANVVIDGVDAAVVRGRRGVLRDLHPQPARR